MQAVAPHCRFPSTGIAFATPPQETPAVLALFAVFAVLTPSPSPSCRGPQPASGLLLAIPLALAVPLVALARRLLSLPYPEAAWCVCVCLCGCVSVRVYVRTRVYKEFEHLPLAEILSGFGDALIPTLVRVPSPILIQTGKKMGIGVQNVWSL